MARSIVIIIISMLGCIGIQQNTAFALGDERRELDLKNFNRIEVSGVYDLRIRKGDEFRVVLEGHEKVLNRATVKVFAQTLKLGRRKGPKIRRSKTVQADITLPDLKGLTVSGVVDAIVTDVDAELFTVNISGVGELRISGECERLRAHLSGVGELNARKLNCEQVKVNVSGVGDATVYASEMLDAHVSGIGDLTCYGSPKQVRKNSSFFSTIRVH